MNYIRLYDKIVIYIKIYISNSSPRDPSTPESRTGCQKHPPRSSR
jgi:hypothetical protein